MAINPLKSDQSDGTRDLFLSYNTRDAAAVCAIAERLHAAKLTTFLDKKDLKPGLPWMPDIEHSISQSRALAVFISKHGFGPYQETEVQLAIIRQVDERKNGRAFPLIPVLLPGAEPENISGFLRLNHFLDLRNDAAANDQLQSLISTIRGGKPSSITETEIDLCPYRALRAFREEDAPLFFGREEFAQQLLAKTQQHSLIAVVGPSGSGKSSVVQAGLMPLLRRERSPQPTWDAVVFTPGTRPFYSLATTLVAIWGAELSVTQILREAEELSEDLAIGKTRLENALSQAIAASEGVDRLLVVVDQFEELFTQTEEKDRKPFIAALLSAASVVPVTIALTLRADFYGQTIGLDRDLSDRMQQGVVNLGPMTRDELRHAIENPAHSVELKFESGLVNRILDNIEFQPGNLPLLEFALTELWDRRQGHLLTHRQYDEIGEVEGAIGQRAEQLFGGLKPDEQRAALRAFTRLVRVAAANEEGTDTRQRVRLSELGETARVVAQQFVKARLLVTSRHEATDENIIEVAHEALIRRWERLKEVLSEDREFLLWRQRLRSMLSVHVNTGRHSNTLLANFYLREAKQWREKHPNDLSKLEREFIAKSDDEYLWINRYSLTPRLSQRDSRIINTARVIIIIGITILVISIRTCGN